MRYLASKYSIILAAACMILVWGVQAGVKQFRILHVRPEGPQKFNVTIDTGGLQGFSLGTHCVLKSDLFGEITTSGKGHIKEILDSTVVAEISVPGEFIPTAKDTIEIDLSGLSTPSKEKPAPKASPPVPQSPPKPMLDTKGNELAVKDLETSVSSHDWPGVEEKLYKADDLKGLTDTQKKRIQRGKAALKFYLESRSIIRGEVVAHTRDLRRLDQDLKQVLLNRTDGRQLEKLSKAGDLMAACGDLDGQRLIAAAIKQVKQEALQAGEIAAMKSVISKNISATENTAPQKAPASPRIDTKGNELAVKALEKAVSSHDWPGVEEKLRKADGLKGLTDTQKKRIQKGRAALKFYLESRSIIRGEVVAHTRGLRRLDQDLKQVLLNRTDGRRLEKLSKAGDLMAACGDPDGQRRIAAAIKQVKQEAVPAGEIAAMKSVISKDLSARDWSSLETHLIQVVKKFNKSDLSTSDKAFFRKILEPYNAYLKGRSALLPNGKYKTVGEMDSLTIDLETARTTLDESRFLTSCRLSSEWLSLAGDEKAAGTVRQAALDFSAAKKRDFKKACAAHFTTLRNAFDAKEYDQLGKGYKKSITRKCLERFKEYESFSLRVSNILTALASAEKIFKKAVDLQKTQKDYYAAIKSYESAAKAYSDIGDSRMKDRAFRGISECRQKLEKEKTKVKERLIAIEKGAESCDSSRCANRHLSALEGLRKEAADIFEKNDDIRRAASRAEDKARQVLKKYDVSEEIRSAIYKIKRRAAGCSTESCCQSARRDLSRLVSSQESHVRQFLELKKELAGAEYEITARVREIRKEKVKRAEEERRRRQAEAVRERERQIAEKKRAEEEAARKTRRQTAKKEKNQDRLRRIIP